MEQLKPKDLVGMWERSRAIGKRETEAHFNQERGYLQQRVPRISVHHTNGIPWAWASTLHLSDIPKLNARPGMAQYSPGITDDHICILPCQRVFHFQPCPCQNPLSENTFSLLLLFLHLQYAKSLFLSTLFPPRGRSGEGGLIHLLSRTLPSSYPAVLPCIHLTLHYRTVSLITPFFFWPFSASSTLIVTCQEKHLCVQCSLPENFLSQFLSSLLSFPTS